MKIEQLAVLVYGVVAYLLAALLAFMQHSTLSIAVLFAAAGCTYLFQAFQVLFERDPMDDEDPSAWETVFLLVLFIISILLPPIAVLIAVTEG